MEFIIEMNEAHQLTLPDALVDRLDLQPGAHFAARLEGGRLIIERTPFFMSEEARVLETTRESLKQPQKIE